MNLFIQKCISRIRFILILLLLSSAAHFTMAQTLADSAKTKSYDLNEVIITASRTPVTAQSASRMVTVISKAEIEQSPAQNLNDLLRYVAGVDIRQRGPQGVQADISMRGGTFDQTLILLNGVNITDPQTGHHTMNLPVDIESIERIEILRGPAAKSFGPNAFTGVINIITGNSKPNHVRLSGMYGDNGLYRTSLNISNSTGKFSHFLSANHTASEGYMKNTDFRISNLFYQARYSVKPGTFDFQSGLNARDFGANSFYSLKYPNQFESTRTEFASLKFESNTRIRLTPVIYFRRNKDRFELKRDNDSVPFNHHITHTAGVNMNASYSSKAGRSSLGIDFRNEQIISTVLGELMADPKEITGYEGHFYTKSFSRLSTSLYAEQTLILKSFSITAGLMAHHNAELKGLGIYPGLDVSYRFSKGFTAYASANKTLRMPTFTDMFYKSPVQQGNVNLLPEEAFTLEGGVRYTGTQLKAYISAFQRNGDNLIDWVKSPSPDSLIWRSMNQTHIRFTGVEGSVSLTPPDGFFRGRVKSVSLSASLLQDDFSSNGMLSKYALDYLKDQVTASLDMRIAWKLYNSTRLTRQDRNSTYADASGQIRDYEPFWLCDSRLYWQTDTYLLYAEASNLFNTSYYDFGGIRQPGIWVRGGIQLNLDYRK
jgi:vitamin B12 transporter